jgi:rare lipoprotein A
MANSIKNRYRKKTVVQVKVVNGVRYYSLILGPFSSQTKAESFVGELKKQFPDAFVLDYARQ